MHPASLAAMRALRSLARRRGGSEAGNWQRCSLLLSVARILMSVCRGRGAGKHECRRSHPRHGSPRRCVPRGGVLGSPSGRESPTA
eukprot:scaffold217_cov377-Prasinococcus_capsulatus_cf.AAC.22